MTFEPNHRDADAFSPERVAERASPRDVHGDGAPLNEVFRALAEDLGNGRLSGASRRLADELDRGVDLSTAMRAIDGEYFPAPLHRALVASADTGHTAAILQGLAQHQSACKRLRRQMRSALIYPTVVLVLFAAVVMGLMFVVVPHFRDMFADFGFTLPRMTVFVLEASESVPWAILGCLLVVPVYFIVGLLPGGRRLVHWLRTGLPVLGRIWIWNGQHEFASVLGSLVSRSVMLDEALHCAAATMHDQNLARAARIAVGKCEGGATLSQAMSESLHFDRALTGLVAWGEANDALPEALRQGAAMYEREVELQVILVRRVLPPILFISVATVVFAFVVALMIPIVDLTNALSY